MQKKSNVPKSKAQLHNARLFGPHRAQHLVSNLSEKNAFQMAKERAGGMSAALVPYRDLCWEGEGVSEVKGIENY